MSACCGPTSGTQGGRQRRWAVTHRPVALPRLFQICHLSATWIASEAAVRVREGAVAVAADDLHSGMVGEPGRERGRLPVGQQADGGVGLAVDLVALAGGEFIAPSTWGVCAYGSARAMARLSRVVSVADRIRQPGRQTFTGAAREGRVPKRRPSDSASCR